MVGKCGDWNFKWTIGQLTGTTSYAVFTSIFDKSNIIYTRDEIIQSIKNGRSKYVPIAVMQEALGSLIKQTQVA